MNSRPRSLGLLICITAIFVAGSTLDRDDETLCFPAAGFIAADGTVTAQLRCWVFEPERDSVKRRILIGWLQSVIGLAPGDSETPVFKERVRWFVVDNQRDKDLVARLGEAAAPLNPTDPGGHSVTTVSFALKGPTADRTVKVRITDTTGRLATEATVLLQNPRQGLSVISDIDDTIKISAVTDRSELARNTFLRPFTAVSGMATRYAVWAHEGARFHYVSGSPWHLYPPLDDFLRRSGFPAGTVHLKDFRVKDASGLRFLVADQRTYKTGIIEELLAAAPGRRFVLVGDAGEMDPEIYSTIARRNPGRIAAIYIRDPAGASAAEARWRQAFAECPAPWLVFSDARELPRSLSSGSPRP